MSRQRGVLIFGAVMTLTYCGLSVAGSARPVELHPVAIGDGRLSIQLPANSKLHKDISFESETYYASFGNARLVSIYLGNNPELSPLARRRTKSEVRLQAGAGIAYFSRGRITDVVVRPRCGHDRYVWLTWLDGTAQGRINRDIMTSLRCAGPLT